MAGLCDERNESKRCVLDRQLLIHRVIITLLVSSAKSFARLHPPRRIMLSTVEEVAFMQKERKKVCLHLLPCVMGIEVLQLVSICRGGC